MLKIYKKDKILTMNLDEFQTPAERAKNIAAREKKRRKQKKITQKELSQRTGVSLGSIKRFEQTGEISFVSLLKIADILEEAEEFDNLFCRREYKSIEEVLDELDK